MYLYIKNVFKGHSGLNTICDACLQKMSDQFDPLDKVQRPHQHLLSRDEHRQPHQASARGSSINHVVTFLGIFDPPSWSLLLNKTYVIKWSFG